MYTDFLSIPHVIFIIGLIRVDICTLVMLNITSVYLNITHVSLNNAPISLLRLLLALNDGNGNMIQLKSLQSAVFFLYVSHKNVNLSNV